MQSISSLVKLTEKHKYYHKMHTIVKNTYWEGPSRSMARVCKRIYMRHEGPKPYQQRVLGDSRPPEAHTFQMILGGFWAL